MNDVIEFFWKRLLVLRSEQKLKDINTADDMAAFTAKSAGEGTKYIEMHDDDRHIFVFRTKDNKHLGTIVCKDDGQLI